MNTKIRPLYRDADNKVHNECGVEGVLTEQQIKKIMDCCDGANTLSPDR